MDTPDVLALTEWESKQRLVGVPLVPECRCATEAEVVDALEALQGPYVVKASGVTHKSEDGLVKLGLDRAAAKGCWRELANAGDGTVLVAEMVKAELELVVGGLRDPHFGPVVTIGLGGVNAEVLRDAVTMLAPTEPGEVATAIGLLSGAKLLQGYRGSEPVNVAALETIVDAVARLLEDDDTVVEIDCNPVMICKGQPVVVDALVVTRRPTCGILPQ